MQFRQYGHVYTSTTGLGMILGGALPSFVIAMLFAIFPRGYAGMIIGVVVAMFCFYLQWLGTSVR
jgi:hypothetical protein